MTPNVTAAAALLTAITLSAAARAQPPQGQAPIAPLSNLKATSQPRVACSDFAKSITTGVWSPTHDLHVDGLDLKQGAPIDQRAAQGADLIAKLQIQCGARRPAG